MENIQQKAALARQIAYSELKNKPEYQFSPIPQSVLNNEANKYMKLSLAELQKRAKSLPTLLSGNKNKDGWDRMGIHFTPEQKRKTNANMAKQSHILHERYKNTPIPKGSLEEIEKAAEAKYEEAEQIKEQKKISKMTPEQRKNYIAEKVLNASGKKDIAGMGKALYEFFDYDCGLLDNEHGINKAKAYLAKASGAQALGEFIDKEVDDGNPNYLSKKERIWEIIKGFGNTLDSFTGTEGLAMGGILGAGGKAAAAIPKVGPLISGSIQAGFGAQGTEMVYDGTKEEIKATTKEEARNAASEASMGFLMVSGAGESFKVVYKSGKWIKVNKGAKLETEATSAQAEIEEKNTKVGNNKSENLLIKENTKTFSYKSSQLNNAGKSYEIIPKTQTEIKELTDTKFEAKKVEIIKQMQANKTLKKIDSSVINQHNIFVIESIIKNHKFHEYKNFTDNIGDIILDTDTAEKAKARTDIIDKLGQNPKLLEYKNITDYIGTIIRHTDSAERATVASKTLDYPQLFKYKNFTDRIGEIIFSSYTAERAKAKIDIIDKLGQNPKCLKYKNFTDHIGTIIYSSNTAESAKAKIDIIDKLGQNPKLLEYKNFTDRIGYIITDINTAEKAKARTDIIDKLGQNPKLLEYKNITDYIGTIIRHTDSAERATVASKTLDYPQLFKYKNFTDCIGEIITDSNTAEGAQAKIDIIDKLGQNPKLLEYKNITDYIGTIIRHTDSAERATVASKIIDTPKLLEYKNFTDRMGEIIFSSYTPEKVKTRTDIINKVGQNPKLLENKNFTDHIGDIILDTDTAEKAKLKIDCIDRIIPEPNFKDYDISNLLLATSIEDFNSKLEVDNLLINKKVNSNLKNYFLAKTNSKSKENILNKINKINNNTEYPNLTHLADKEHINFNKLDDILIQFPQTNRNVGGIPGGWLNNVPKSEQKTTVSSLYDILGDFADSNLSDNNKEQAISEKLSKLLNDKVSINYLSSGAYGNGYKVTIGEKSFLLKTFHETGTSRIHGSGIEPQTGPYSNHSARAKQFTKFYFGRVAGSIYSDGFMVNEFLEPSSKITAEAKKNNPIIESKPLYIDFVTSGDYQASSEGSIDHNTINGRIIDFGAFSIDKLLENPKLRQNCRIFGERIYKDTYKNSSVKYVMSRKNEQILSDYAKKNMSKSEFDAALKIYSKKLSKNDGIIQKLKNIRTNLYGNN